MRQGKKLLAACVCLLILIVSGILTVNAHGEREAAVRKAPLDTQRDYSIERRAMDPKSDAIDRFIGETEKNLPGTFDRAPSPGRIPYYDEADELFERRTGIPDEADKLFERRTDMPDDE